MKNNHKPTVTKGEISKEMPAVKETVESIIDTPEQIQPDHIGLIHKSNPASRVVIHKSMRRFYENDDWTIIEPVAKKK